MGKRYLDDAIQQFGQPVQVEYKSFELDPTRGRDVDENMYEHLAKKYGMSIEQAKANTQNVVRMAKEVGLDFQFDTLILTNTFDAHRLTKFAQQHGLMKEMAERLYRAHFTESKHIGDHETLMDLAEDVGLNREDVGKMLASDEMAADVRADIDAARQYRITSVPFFLINKKYAVTGAQPTKAFVEAFEKISAET